MIWGYLFAMDNNWEPLTISTAVDIPIYMEYQRRPLLIRPISSYLMSLAPTRRCDRSKACKSATMVPIGRELPKTSNVDCWGAWAHPCVQAGAPWRAVALHPWLLRPLRRSLAVLGKVNAITDRLLSPVKGAYEPTRTYEIITAGCWRIWWRFSFTPSAHNYRHFLTN